MKSVFSGLCAIIFTLWITGCGKVGVVKNGTLSDLNPNVTLGDAFKKCLDSSKWESIKGPTGEDMVQVSGKVNAIYAETFSSFPSNTPLEEKYADLCLKRNMHTGGNRHNITENTIKMHKMYIEEMKKQKEEYEKLQKELEKINSEDTIDSNMRDRKSDEIYRCEYRRLMGNPDMREKDPIEEEQKKIAEEEKLKAEEEAYYAEHAAMSKEIAPIEVQVTEERKNRTILLTARFVISKEDGKSFKPAGVHATFKVPNNPDTEQIIGMRNFYTSILTQ